MQATPYKKACIRTHTTQPTNDTDNPTRTPTNQQPMSTSTISSASNNSQPNSPGRIVRPEPNAQNFPLLPPSPKDQGAPAIHPQLLYPRTRENRKRGRTAITSPSDDSQSGTAKEARRMASGARISRIEQPIFGPPPNTATSLIPATAGAMNHDMAIDVDPFRANANHHNAQTSQTPTPSANGQAHFSSPDTPPLPSRSAPPPSAPAPPPSVTAPPPAQPARPGNVNDDEPMYDRLLRTGQATKEQLDAAFGDIPPEYKAVDPPTTDYEKVQGIYPHQLVANFERKTAGQWRNYPRTYAFILPAYNKASDDREEQQAALKQVIMRNLRAPLTTIANPAFTRSKKSPHYPFIVTGISEEDTHRLTERGLWITRAITFFAFAPDAQVLSYIMTLTGLDLPSNDFGCRVVKNLLRKHLREDQIFVEFIFNHKDAYPHDLSGDQVLTIMLDNIDVKAEGLAKRGSQIVKPTFKIYFKLSTYNHTIAEDITHHLRSQLYATEWGTATAHHTFLCTICHGQDHPNGLCPFTNLPNWPKLLTTAPHHEQEQHPHRNDTPRYNRNGQAPMWKGKSKEREKYNGGNPTTSFSSRKPTTIQRCR